MSRNELRGLYAITEASLQSPGQLLERAAQALDGGVRVLQYRDKSDDAALRLRQARGLAELCRAHGVALIINDDVQLAADSGADGVHLGKDDANPAAARRRLGTQAIVGVSCYNQWERAQRAAEQGADYIAFGRFFASRTKPAAAQADAQLIARARRELGLPVVAIGGITPHNGVSLIAAGADMLAVVQGVFAADDVRRAAAAYAALFAANG